MTEKRFTYEYDDDDLYDSGFFLDNGKEMFKDDVLNTLNNLNEENEQLKKQLKDCTAKAKEEIRKQEEENAIRWANIGM